MEGAAGCPRASSLKSSEEARRRCSGRATRQGAAPDSHAAFQREASAHRAAFRCPKVEICAASV